MMRVLHDAEFRLDAAPYQICLFSFPVEAVVEIVIGSRSSRELRNGLTNLSTGFPKARLLQAEEHSSQYALVMNAV